MKYDTNRTEKLQTYGDGNLGGGGHVAEFVPICCGLSLSLWFCAERKPAATKYPSTAPGSMHNSDAGRPVVIKPIGQG